MAAISLGSAYFQLVPSMAGFSQAVGKELGGLKGLGASAGKQLGGTVQKAFADQTKNLAQTSVSKLTAEVASASKIVAAARQKEADASGRLRIAETLLAEARGKYASDSSQVIRAEERVAAATRSVASVQQASQGAAEKLSLVNGRLSAANEKLAAASRDAASSTTRSASGIRGALGGIGSSIRGISSVSFSGLSKGLAQTRSSLSGLSSGFSDLGRIAGGFVVGNLVYNGLGRAFDAGATAVFGFNSQLQNAQIAFTTMLGSGTKAQTFLEGLKTFAKTTPFEFPDLVTASQRLLAMGVASKDVIPYMTGIGDAVAGLGGGADKIDQVVTAIGQMTAKGKIQSDELLQLTEAGIPALKILADTYGVTTSQMQAMVTKGQVVSSKAVPALIAGLEKGTKSTAAFGGMMAKQSTTFTGAMSNIADATNQTLATAFKPLFDTASAGLQKLATALSTPAFSNFATNFAAGLQVAITNIGTFFNQAGPGFAALMAKIGPLVPLIVQFGTVLGTQFAGIAAKVSPVLQQIGAELPAIFAKVFPVVQSVIGAIIGAVNTLLPPILNLAQVAFPLIASAVATVFPVIVRVFNSIVAAVTPLIQLLSVVLPPVFTGLLAIVGPVFNTIGNIIVGVMGVVQGIITTVLGVVTGNWDQAWQGLVGVVQGVWNVILAVIRAPLAVITNVIQSNLFGIRDTWNNFWAGIGSTLGRVWNGIVSTVTGGVGRVVSAVQTINGRIMSAIGNVGNLLISSGRALIQGFIDGITGMLGNVGNAVGGVMDFVKGFFPHSPAKRGPFSGAGWRQVASSGATLASQFTGGFNDGVKDFASTVGGIVPDTISSSVAGTITNTSRAPSTSVLIANKTNVRLEDLVDVRIARNSDEETRAQRLGYQPLVFG